MPNNCTGTLTHTVLVYVENYLSINRYHMQTTVLLCITYSLLEVVEIVEIHIEQVISEDT